MDKATAAAHHATLPAFFRQFSVSQLAAQYAKNAAGLRTMHAKAVDTGKKVNNYTADQLSEMADRYEALARGYSKLANAS
jgi:hypothetical protein